ncbi:hypothetical protein LX32DRAFT_646565 [Colletotrichum zoysiae]|uniref:Uncharacterized protein n=1 Tax=Colletotrichum zoysiae TaxID=1216348 RepID=A0AAD9LWW8_9PEZI|nr:hypothetical protein LX32DRAFT_646565 [Colletotrichum zoysiae]
MLRVSGTRVVDENGKEILLKGAGIGGMPNMENFITGYAGHEHEHRAAMTEVLGKDKANFFFAHLMRGRPGRGGDQREALRPAPGAARHLPRGRRRHVVEHLAVQGHRLPGRGPHRPGEPPACGWCGRSSRRSSATGSISGAAPTRAASTAPRTRPL